MDLDELEKLVSLMKEADLAELEIDSGDKRIRLKKATDPVVVATAAAAPLAAGPAPVVPAAAVPDVAAAPADNGVEGDSLTFNSPMVGTFYSAPSPTADSFVKIGDRVGKTTVVCIIEAMKVMNEITAELEGEILEVLVGNGEAVEYNQPLFTLRPTT